MIEETEIPYGVAGWPEACGLHRAVVRVAAPADAVLARLSWRRRDRDPARIRVILTDAHNVEIPNMVVTAISSEEADVVFQATAAGDYFVYYYPQVVQTDYGWYRHEYPAPEDTADAAWRHQVAAAETLALLPRAQVIAFQARSDFDRFDPMEIVATAAEMAALRAAHPEACLLFPEDRRLPIRMHDALPRCWVQRGPSTHVAGTACRNEFYAFQLGVYAAGSPVEAIAVEVGDLRAASGAVLPAAALRCVNLGGIDWDGTPFTTVVSVPLGRVQALWFCLDIPASARPGCYEGMLILQARDLPPIPVTLAVTVTDELLADRGDSEPWRHSRLRWLDSTLGDDDDTVDPFPPLAVDGRTVHCLHRAVTVGDMALPAAIESGGIALLAAPLSFQLAMEGMTVRASGVPRLERRADGLVDWSAAGSAGPLALHAETRMECDGWVRVRLDCRATADLTVDDLRLELPLRRAAVPYLMGGGRKGGHRPASHTWTWSASPEAEDYTSGVPYYDSFWMGDVAAGLQCELRGAEYCGPMVNLYWRLGEVHPPASWYNEGRGCVTFSEDGDCVRVCACSGSRVLQAGEELTFEFALLVTPVKPLDPARHFNERYCHSALPIADVVAAGANIVNVHHATPLNPYINYPFFAGEALAAYAREAHARGVKVKIYYTVRELTNRIPEIWALRSLGHEVLAPGPGGGHPWLRQHLLDDYTPAWYDHMDGAASQALVNSGASRWYNYYLEGLAWLLREVEIDGLYLDDVSYDRHIVRRMRKIMNRLRPGCLIDLHSHEGFSCGPANQYLEFFPYIDSLWFGEAFDYDAPPDYWLTEISGIPYGLMGDMLQDGGNRWRGMIYGMTARYPHGPNADPRPVWRIWDDFGIAEARMLGYWDPACPVHPDDAGVKATAYIRADRTLIALASWAPAPVDVRLQIDWGALGLAPGPLAAPAVDDFQPARTFAPGEAIPVDPGRGWLLVAGRRA